MPGLWLWGDQEIKDFDARLKRIEHKLDRLILSKQEQDMAEIDEINNLKAQVEANTTVVTSATTALAGFVQTVSDLTAQLQAAVAADNSAAIKAAADAIAANNAQLDAAVPVFAQAIKANTTA